MKDTLLCLIIRFKNILTRLDTHGLCFFISFYLFVYFLLTDDPNSRVWGSLRNGVFEGVIESDYDGTYYVERAHKYFPNHNSTKSGFHSLIYHDRHVEDPYSPMRQGHKSGCGATDDVAAWMDNVQNSADLEEERQEAARRFQQTPAHLRSQYKYKQWLDSNDQYKTVEEGVYNLIEDYHNKYSEEANRRGKRAAGIAVGEDNKGTCSLSIQTDPMLWHHIFKQVRGYDCTSITGCYRF